MYMKIRVTSNCWDSSGDVPRIFMYIAQQLGAKNVEDFRRNMDRVQGQTMPDEMVAQQAQAGNLVPTNQI